MAKGQGTYGNYSDQGFAVSGGRHAPRPATIGLCLRRARSVSRRSRPTTIAALPEQPGQADPKERQAAEQPNRLQPPRRRSRREAAERPRPPAPEAARRRRFVAPSFDVVRVEGDGSIVIAGKATPNAKVELLIGSNVIGEATAGAGRRFRRRARRAAEARRLPDRAALDRARQCRRHVGRDGGRVGPRNQGRPGAGAGRGARQAVRDDHRSGAEAPAEAAPQPPAARRRPPQPPARRTQARRTGSRRARLPPQSRRLPQAPRGSCGDRAARRGRGGRDRRPQDIRRRRGRSGRTVRGYANDILLGDAKARRTGAF